MDKTRFHPTNQGVRHDLEICAGDGPARKKRLNWKFGALLGARGVYGNVSLEELEHSLDGTGLGQGNQRDSRKVKGRQSKLLIV